MLDWILNIQPGWGHVFVGLLCVAIYDTIWDALPDDWAHNWFDGQHLPRRMMGWGIILALLVVSSIDVVYGVLLAIGVLLIVFSAIWAGRRSRTTTTTTATGPGPTTTS